MSNKKINLPAKIIAIIAIIWLISMTILPLIAIFWER